MAAHM